MKALTWFYRRIGQMLCFWLSVPVLFLSQAEYSEDAMRIAGAIVFVGLLFTGLGLRALNVWRETPRP